MPMLSDAADNTTNCLQDMANTYQISIDDAIRVYRAIVLKSILPNSEQRANILQDAADAVRRGDDEAHATLLYTQEAWERNDADCQFAASKGIQI